jgi:hypothetical protein
MSGAMAFGDVTSGYSGGGGYGWMVAGSSLAGSFNALSSGMANRYMLKAKQKLDDVQFSINRRVVQLKQEDAQRRGQEALRQSRLATRRTIGASRAALAAQGIQLDTGSALDIQMDIARQGALDDITIKNNTFKEAWGYKMASINVDAQAAASHLSTQFQAQSSILAGIGSAAGYTSRGFMNYYGRR